MLIELLMSNPLNVFLVNFVLKVYKDHLMALGLIPFTKGDNISFVLQWVSILGGNVVAPMTLLFILLKIFINIIYFCHWFLIARINFTQRQMYSSQRNYWVVREERKRTYFICIHSFHSFQLARLGGHKWGVLEYTSQNTLEYLATSRDISKILQLLWLSSH